MYIRRQRYLSTPIFALFLLVTAFSTTPLFAQVIGTTQNVIGPNDPAILYFGRWDRTDPTVSHSHWQDGYVRARFTGTTIGVKLQSGCLLGVRIDGEAVREVNASSGVTPLNLVPLKPGLHSVLVSSPQGSEMLFQGLVLDPGAKIVPAVPRPIIEFIGDSITWGTGPGNLWGVNWTWNSAEALNCDHTDVAQSGRALTSGYGCAQPLVGLDTQYFKLKNFGYINPPDWNMTTYTPSVVCINLGQNDACGNEQDSVFIPSYTNFVKKIRSYYPKAEIVAIRMFGGGHFGDDTRQVIAALNAAGDRHVHFIDTAGWLSKEDYRDGVHPNDLGNTIVAEHLAPALAPIIHEGGIQTPSLTATVGSPANPVALMQQIQDAYYRGEKTITVTPGVYVFPSMQRSHLPINYWHDVTIRAYGCTFLLDDPTSSDILFDLNGCRNVTIEGCLTSQTTQPAYQGRITNTGKNDQGNECVDWTPSVGYPVVPDGTATIWINVVDGKTGLLKYGVQDYYQAPLQSLGGGVWRIQFNEPNLRFGVGDILVSRYSDPPRKVNLSGCSNCTIADFTMMRNGFAPIFDGGGAGNHYLRCHWALGPKPNGATENPVVTNAADGIHCPGDYPGPDIENCTFDGVFLDDCIAIHGNYQTLNSVNGSTMVTANGYANLRNGEPARFSDPSGFYLQANVTSLKDNGNGTTTFTIDGSTTVPVDARVSNPLRDGEGYKIIDCRLGDTRSRGIICKADNGVIEGNTIFHCGQGISIGPEYGEKESDYSHTVLITGNTFVDDGTADDVSLLIHGEGDEQNTNITIQGNKFLSDYGAPIHLDCVDGATVSGNTFTAPSAPHTWDTQSPLVSLTRANNVTISGNKVSTPNGFAKPLVQPGNNVTQLTSDIPSSAL